MHGKNLDLGGRKNLVIFCHGSIRNSIFMNKELLKLVKKCDSWTLKMLVFDEIYS